MKNSIKFLIVLFVMSSVFAGCDKDKDKDDDTDSVVVAPTNYFMHGTTSYDISQCLMFGYGEYQPGIFSIDINFITPGITLHQSNGQIDSTSGNGNIVYFELMTSDATLLDVGTYTYSDGTTSEIKTFEYGGAIIDYKSDGTGDETEYEVASGTLTVISNSSTIEITYDCIDLTGNVLKGHYKGAYTFIDDSKKKGKKKRLF